MTPVTRRLKRPNPAKGRSAKLHDVRNVHRLAWQASSAGQLEWLSPVSGEWEIAGNCSDPVPVELRGAPGRIAGGKMVRKDGRSYTLTLQTRCRKCLNCLRARSRRWAHRAAEEIRASVRTWFCTFTLSPSNAFMLRCRAAVRLTRGGTSFEALSPSEQFSELVLEYGAELTKYIKRLRKNTGARFRYILVAERHKSGVPHWHALIHEQDPLTPLRHATLAAGYKLGFTQFKLCEGTETAWYVAKYLSKSAEARIRASSHYGSPSQREEITASCPSRLWPTCNIQPLQPQIEKELEANIGISDDRSSHSTGQQSPARQITEQALPVAKTLAGSEETGTVPFPDAYWSSAPVSTALPWAASARPDDTPASQSGAGPEAPPPGPPEPRC